ncbi:MAG: hypothetical protein AAGI53_05145 [Planctomycetota bacterium]
MKLDAPVILSVLALGFAAPAGVAQSCPTAFTNGSRNLFIGHSFLLQPSLQFSALADLNGYTWNAYSYSGGSGSQGSPGELWDDADGSRTEIEAKLATGAFEVLAMTSFGQSTNTLDFRRWMNLALSYNPNTQFFIVQGWPSGGPGMDAAEFRETVISRGENLFSIVETLRGDFPNNRVTFVNSGMVAAELFDLWESGELPDVACLAAPCDTGEPLFADGGSGHAGPMMAELMGLAWLNALNGADVDTVQLKVDYLADVDGVMERVLAFNDQFETTTTSLPHDWNTDGECSFFDIASFLRNFDAGNMTTDLTGDGILDGADILRLIEVLP